GRDVGTLVIDPWSNIYDQLVAVAPKKHDSRDGELKPDYELVNSKLLGFLTALRRFDVHLVIVTHLKENEGKRGDGRTYARFGGMGLIRKAMAEMDVIALVQRTEPEDGDPVWFAEIQPTDGWAGKDGTDSLGARRIADLSRWVELARAANAVQAVDTDLPWTDDTSDGEVLPDSPSSSALPHTPVAESTEAPSQGSGDRPPDDALAKPAEPDAAPAEPTSDAEAQAALARATAAEPEPLDADDWALLTLLLAGNNAEQCASRLQANPAEIREHVTAIKRKMRVRTITALLELAREMPRETVAP
ncbi:MAG TPA: hypothetical protein VIJ16_11055, partial [Gemmatimonadaceae bacterium]